MDTSTQDIRTSQEVLTNDSPIKSQNIAGKRSLLVLILLCSAQFMVVLDFSIVNVALPAIQRDLGFTTQNLQWIVTAYSLTFGGFLLLGGRIGDLFGRRRLFTIGLVLFAFASFMGGIAQSALWLILARAVQGLGAAIISPTSFSLITTTFHEGPARNKALGVVGAVASSGFAAGALLGGLLTAGPGWRWVLFVNVPVAIVAIILTPILLSETAKEQGQRQVDVLGAITITIGLVALVYALAQGNQIGWGSPQTLGLLGMALVLLVTFVFIEARVKVPLIRLSIFRLRTLTGANLIGLFAPGALGAMVFIVTLYMQKVLGYAPVTTGIAFLPMALVFIVVTNVVSQFVPRFGVQRLLIAGMFVMALGLLLLTRISVENNYWTTLFPGTLVVALGIGPSFTVMAIAATAGVSDREQGLASGLLNTTQQVGSGLVLAVVAVVSATQTTALQYGQGVSPKVALVSGFQYAFIVCAVFAVLGALAAIFVIRQNEQSAGQQ
ncbi:MAG: DHA2 family efflux MFS transporter permease subunit [Ktedonobacteraceae bacterium]